MKTIYGIVWLDNLLGPLTLNQPDKESALKTSEDMRIRGAGKISNCRAVEVTSENKLIYLN